MDMVMQQESIRFDHAGDCGRLALAGALTPDAALEVLSNAVTNSITQNLRALIVDLTQASLTHEMSVTECHHAGSQLARCGAKLRGIAFLLREECTERVAFVCTVAANRGLRAATFRDESAARGWLAG